MGIVNLKPLLPGHVLIIPNRVVPRLSDLNTEEVSDLFLSVQKVGKVLESAYKGEGLTISLQDGATAGQSVPHVHVHIIPRRKGPPDYANNDDIYPAIEGAEAALRDDLARSSLSTARMADGGDGAVDGNKGESGWKVPRDEDRKARTQEEMEEEARWLAGWLG